MFGPDVAASLTPAELRQLVDGVRFIERMKAHPVDKAKAAADLKPLRQIFMKSVVAAADLPAGTVLGRELLAAKKPGTGIPARELPGLLGRRLKRAVARDTLLSNDDLA
jgi:N-acetylneuraminate synthase